MTRQQHTSVRQIILARYRASILILDRLLSDLRSRGWADFARISRLHVKLRKLLARLEVALAPPAWARLVARTQVLADRGEHLAVALDLTLLQKQMRRECQAWLTLSATVPTTAPVVQMAV